jgi:hypothetical protein
MLNKTTKTASCQGQETALIYRLISTLLLGYNADQIVM